MENKYPWRQDVEWEKRTKLIAKIIPSYLSVVDLGGGYENLNKYLIKCLYKSIDKYLCTTDTIVADFNKDEFPDGDYEGQDFDYIVCQGTLEYITDPNNFLQKIKKYGDVLILTYRIYEKSPIDRNYYGFENIRFFLKENGWEIILEKVIEFDKKIESDRELLFYCRKM